MKTNITAMFLNPLKNAFKFNVMMKKGQDSLQQTIKMMILMKNKQKYDLKSSKKTGKMEKYQV